MNIVSHENKHNLYLQFLKTKLSKFVILLKKLLAWSRIDWFILTFLGLFYA